MECRKQKAETEEIEITPAMIEAGETAIAEIGDASAAYLAKEVYQAMYKARPPARMVSES